MSRTLHRQQTALIRRVCNTCIITTVTGACMHAPIWMKGIKVVQPSRPLTGGAAVSSFSAIVHHFALLAYAAGRKCSLPLAVIWRRASTWVTVLEVLSPSVTQQVSSTLNFCKPILDKIFSDHSTTKGGHPLFFP
jgi:hypothetical protein